MALCASTAGMRAAPQQALSDFRAALAGTRNIHHHHHRRDPCEQIGFGGGLLSKSISKQA
jgi:hypothetical protein